MYTLSQWKLRYDTVAQRVFIGDTTLLYNGATIIFVLVSETRYSVFYWLLWTVLILYKACPGLDVNRSSSSGNTPLHSAANWGFTEVVQILLDKGQAQVNCANPNCDNATPLHLAVMQGRIVGILNCKELEDWNIKLTFTFTW